MTYLVILDCEEGVCKIFPVHPGNDVYDVASDNYYDLDKHHWMECNEIQINS